RRTAHRARGCAARPCAAARRRLVAILSSGCLWRRRGATGRLARLAHSLRPVRTALIGLLRPLGCAARLDLGGLGNGRTCYRLCRPERRIERPDGLHGADAGADVAGALGISLGLGGATLLP